MSYTEIYTFNKKGNAKLFDEINNSHRGAPVIWSYFSKKYYNNTDYYENLDNVFLLLEKKKVSKNEKIILASTLDNAIVKRKDFNKLIDIFISIDIENKNASLKEQAEIFKKINKENKEYIAIGWNQTSVNSDTWENYKYDEENDISIPYNLLEDKKHLDIFEEYYK